jgi:hypothetical protein
MVEPANAYEEYSLSSSETEYFRLFDTNDAGLVTGYNFRAGSDVLFIVNLLTGPNPSDKVRLDRGTTTALRQTFAPFLLVPKNTALELTAVETSGATDLNLSLAASRVLV